MKKIEVIIKPCYRENTKTGKIFVSTIETSIRIRTGETDDNAL